jgi:hypothetical protein
MGLRPEMIACYLKLARAAPQFASIGIVNHTPEIACHKSDICGREIAIESVLRSDTRT